MMAHFLSPVLANAGPVGLRVERTDTWLVTSLIWALDSESRRRGLLGREFLEPGTGLVIAPSQGIHTFGMRFAIDVVCVGRDGQVVKVRPGVPPRRLVLALRAFAMVEVAAGRSDEVGLVAGDQLVAEPSPPATVLSD